MADQRSFPNSPTSVLHARRYIAALLGAWPTETIESATLMVSELATNSVRHAHSGFTINVELRTGRVHVEITDEGRGQPALRSPEPDEPSGRGLRIVELLSSEWGVRESTERGGKGVWFTLAAPPGPSLLDA